jgi:FdhE protein
LASLRHSVEGNWAIFQSAAEDYGVTAEALGFVVYWALSAVLYAARIKWVEPASFAAWSKGYCPFCGSLTGMAYLSKPEGPADEYLPIGGGQKYLHCALCGHHWRFERNRCPACDNNDKDTLVYYQESGETAERFDTCQKCSRYLLCIDLRKSDPTLSMDLSALGMVHLDLLAREKGFTPVAWTPWNRVDAILIT